MKRVFLAILCCVLLIGSIPVASFAAMGGGEIAVPFYNNTAKVSTVFTIDASGNAVLKVSCIGKSGTTTEITAVSRIEKLNSDGSWSIVNIGTADNTWVDTSTSIILSSTHSITVAHGTYRAVINYTVSGSGGADDVIESIIERTY